MKPQPKMVFPFDFDKSPLDNDRLITDPRRQATCLTASWLP
jgi:hypothetical protein